MSGAETFRCEFLLAWEDHTWSTEVLDVPTQYNNVAATNTELEDWWLRRFGSKVNYRKVLAVKVLDLEPQEKSCEHE